MRTIPALGLSVLWLVLPLAGRGQTPVFNINQFSSASDLALLGDAAVSGERLRLTPAEAGRVGGSTFVTKRYVQAGFETTFAFQISGAGGGGGEGLAFVIHNNALPALGLPGASMGYGGIPGSLAIEFDTRQNSINDATANHISVHARGTPTAALTNSADNSASLGMVTNGLPDFADGNIHTARIVYAPGSLSVYVDGALTPVLTVPVDLSARMSLDRGQAWFGFTAANGTGYQVHEIVAWSFFTAATPVTVDITTPLDGASFVAPAIVHLTAAASASNSTVARVEYFQGARRLGQATNSPYAFSWESVAPGSYRIVAVATDALGRTNVSPPVAVTVLAEQPPIGVNFLPNNAGTNAVLAAPDSAGVLPQRYWNNVLVFTNGLAAGQNLRNGLGLGTTLDISADFANGGEHSSASTVTPSHKLMRGFASDQAGTPGFQTNSTITISQIPFALYDLILYSDGNNGQGERVAQFRIGTNSIFLRDGAGANYSGVFSQAAGTSDASRNTSAGNYVRFNSISSNSLTIVVTARSATDSTPRAAVNAIQIIPSVFDATVPPTVVRGPYLQMGTPRSMIVRWRTNRPIQGRVRYGTDAANLDQVIDSPLSTVEHSIQLTNLAPNTKYFYAIGTAVTNLASGPDHFFITSPVEPKPTRIWVIGDAGTAGNGDPARQRSTRDAYYELAGSRYTDVWLMLGDNAYNSGTDTEFQAAVFDMYPTLLRQTPAWSTVGNHETAQSHTFNANIPYYRIFDFPKNGEAGGVPSGTEQYYSFDYGTIHFVCLDAMTSARTPNGPMATWLRQDLEANTNHWLIAFWHHPPYTKGSHDSDNPNGADFELVEMRENILPILESYGVDLVLSGHSHSYERSYLIHGHYGYSTNIQPSMFTSKGSGRFDDDQAYLKTAATPTPYEGTVYIVAGSSGQATFATTPDGTFNVTNHPAMYISMLKLGSLVLDVAGGRLDGRFVSAEGSIDDNFTIFKTAPPAAAQFELTAVRLQGAQVHLSWNATPGRTYIVERSESLVSPVWIPVSGRIAGPGSSLSWSGPAPSGARHVFYRVVCEGN